MKDIRNLFKLEKENKAIKEKVTEDIKTLFEQQEEHYKPSELVTFGITIITLMLIEIKTYQSNNILIKLNHI